MATQIFYGWLTLLLLYWVGRSVGLGRLPACLSLVVLCLASPWLLYTRSLYTEIFCSLLMVLALLLFLQQWIMTAGVVVAIAFAVKPLYVVVGLGWIVFLLLERRFRAAVRLAAILGILGVLLCAYHYQQLGTIFMTGSQEWDPPNSWKRAFGAFVDIEHGVLWFVPWILIVVWVLLGDIKNAWKGPRRVELVIGLPLVLHALLLILHAQTGGDCYASRYYVAFLPWCSLVLVRSLCRKSSTWFKAAAVTLLLGAATWAIPGWLYYHHVWSKPFYTASVDLWDHARAQLSASPEHRR